MKKIWSKKGKQTIDKIIFDWRSNTKFSFLKKSFLKSKIIIQNNKIEQTIKKKKKLLKSAPKKIKVKNKLNFFDSGFLPK